MTFANPVDICNRAAQHCGVQRISDFTEDSRQANEFSFVYDKLRRAELRRNVWAFAIRKAPLRPIDSNTMVLNPAMWSSTTTYPWGAIVSDVSGTFWQSRVQDNVNNAPGNSAAWEVYCGPLAAALYDSSGSTGYFAGELVYETPGDGTYVVYLSLQSNNSSDPRDPTEWVSTMQYSKDNVVAFYPTWAVGTTYAAGASVTYNGSYYVSLASGNVGNQPDISTTKWAVDSSTTPPGYYNSATTYSAGAMCTYMNVNYVALQTTTGNTPASSPTYWAVQSGVTYYVSMIDFNLNNLPTSSPAVFSPTTTYASGQQVCGSDGYIYTSAGNGNIGHDPTATTGYWAATGTLCPWTTVNNFGYANDAWQQLSVYLTDLGIVYPIGSGPSNQAASRNVFRLPANYLRRAPQDPKAGSVSFLGAPTGLMYEDWEIEGNYIVSREVFPIVLRFVADVTDVTTFDDMFCEGLAARIALETVEILTQSTAKMAGIVQQYKTFMGEARIVNGIETGATEPPEDDYVTCRL